jgi:hypothetical protein
MLRVFRRTKGGSPGGRSTLKHVGTAGFLFFLVKGLLWLLVPAFIYATR